MDNKNIGANELILWTIKILVPMNYYGQQEYLC